MSRVFTRDTGMGNPLIWWLLASTPGVLADDVEHELPRWGLDFETELTPEMVREPDHGDDVA